MRESDRHGHVIPVREGKNTICGGPRYRDHCQLELDDIGLSLEEYKDAERAGLASVTAALFRVCTGDYSPEDKQAVLQELFGK